MVIRETTLSGAYLVEQKRFEDDRGYFTTTFTRKDFLNAGLPGDFVEVNVSFNKARGTLRGMHFQIAPKAQPKLVRCTRGAIYDVIVDLRPASPGYCRWLSVELSADNGKALFVPAGFAHGFLTLRENTEVLYQMCEFYSPEHGRGVRWNDKAFGIKWPMENPIMSARDASYPDLKP